MKSKFCLSSIARIVLAIALISFTLTASSTSLQPASKIDPAVLKSMDADTDGKIAVWIKLNQQADLSAASKIENWQERGRAVYTLLRGVADRSQPNLLARIQPARSAGRISDVKTFWIVNLIALKSDRAGLLELAATPEVGQILPRFKLEPPTVVVESTRAAPNAIEWGISKIRAPDVWAAPYNSTGVGVVVANVDTGVQYNHPALIGQYRGNLGGGNFNHNYNWYDPTGASAAPADSNGHGTHTMGTEVGTDGSANQIGVAPGARWMAAFGCCPDNESLLEAQQFMIAPTDLAGANPDPALRPHVLNQSWGGPGGSEVFEDVIAALRASGIFPAFSAGNNGSTSTCGRLGSPGDNPSAFNVGSTSSTDTISSSSSRGPNPITGEIGPEVSAPGVSVRSSVPTNSYSVFSGTSMASPHVAGAVALLISLEPKLTGQIEQLEELLRKTAVGLTSATQSCGAVAVGQIPNNVYGWGRIDVKAAADMVYQAGYLQGTVTVGGVPTGNAIVSFTRLGKTLTTRSDANGSYRVVAGAGSYTVIGEYQGQNASALAITVSQNTTTQHNIAIAQPAHLTLAGLIRQTGSGTPIPAMVLVAGQDSMAPVFATLSGNYSVSVPGAGGQIVVSHPGYQTLTTTVNVANPALNLEMTPTANYTCLDNTQSGGPTYVWNDATSGTAFNLGDDANSTDVTLPGTFTYYGTDYTSVRINSNGFVHFGGSSFSTANMYLPFEGPPNNDAMALGEDLNPESGAQGVIYARTVGTQWVVQFHQVQHWAFGAPETFQIILDTATDQITYHYHTLSAPDFTSVGLENNIGSVGQLYSFRNSANLVAGRSVQFTPATGTAVNWGCDHALTLSIADDSDPVTVGATVTYQIRWNMTGFGGAPQATLSALVPANASFVAASGGVTPSAGVLNWNLGNLRPKAQGTAWFTVTASSGPTLTTSASIQDNSGESRNASTTTTVNGQASMFANGFEGN